MVGWFEINAIQSYRGTFQGMLLNALKVLSTITVEGTEIDFVWEINELDVCIDEQWAFHAHGGHIFRKSS